MNGWFNIINKSYIEYEKYSITGSGKKEYGRKSNYYIENINLKYIYIEIYKLYSTYSYIYFNFHIPILSHYYHIFNFYIKYIPISYLIQYYFIYIYKYY
jgi:hypothetical protein